MKRGYVRLALRIVLLAAVGYVLGDYRTQTQGSRTFGHVSLEHVEGKAITVIRRRSL